MDDAQPTYAEAAGFWNSLNEECRQTLLDGYDGEHPWSLAVQLEEAGMLFETVPLPATASCPSLRRAPTGVLCLPWLEAWSWCSRASSCGS